MWPVIIKSVCCIMSQFQRTCKLSMLSVKVFGAQCHSLKGLKRHVLEIFIMTQVNHTFHKSISNPVKFVLYSPFHSFQIHGSIVLKLARS